MQDLKQENIVIVIGDLGAGANLVKNILLLNEEFDWPNIQTTNRLDFIKKTVYPLQLIDNLDKWIDFEYRFRKFKSYYDVDISDNFNDINTSAVIGKSQNKKIVFLCHWPEYASRLKNTYPNIKLISLYPATNFELLWQIKTYIDKISINKLQNFSFFENPETQKLQYIKTFGEDEYYKFNVLNMIEILDRRKNSYKNINGYAIDIHSLLTNDRWIEGIEEFLNIKLNKKDSIDLLNHWRQLHRPIQEIDNFKWFEKYNARTN
jgi:hypothetical protein